MQYRIKVAKVSGGAPWWETCSIKHKDAPTEAECIQWAVDVIARFNSADPKDRHRKLIAVSVASATVEHVWEKTSLVTERGGYDRMRCRLCGATGKRYGLGQNGVAVDRANMNPCRGKPGS